MLRRLSARSRWHRCIMLPQQPRVVYDAGHGVVPEGSIAKKSSAKLFAIDENVCEHFEGLLWVLSSDIVFEYYPGIASLGSDSRFGSVRGGCHWSDW